MLVSLVLIVGCGAPDPTTGAAVAGVTASVDGETAEAIGAQDTWQAVGMDEISVNRSTPEPEGRNPFRFGTLGRATPQAGPGGGDGPGLSVGPALGGPSDRDPVAPGSGAVSPGGTGSLPLTFLGFLESPGIQGRVVVLTDGELVFHGRVGDVIDGRYRIVGLGLESVDVERVDGQGQQTLRLPSELSSGS